MKLTKILFIPILITTVFLSTTFAAANNVIDLASLENIFKPGVQNVSVMKIMLNSENSIKSKKIQEKMIASINNNLDWYTEYMQKYIESNKTVEWHKNFGISIDEFNYIKTIDKKMKFLEDKKSKLEITKSKTGNLIIKNNKLVPNISNLEVDIKNNVLTTKYGKLEYRDSFEASDDQKLVGRWSGNTWQLDFESAKNIKDIKLIDKNKRYGYIEVIIGKLESSGKILIIYSENMTYQGKSSSIREMIILNN